MQVLTKTRIGNYLRRHLLGDQPTFRQGFKEGIALAQKYSPAAQRQPLTDEQIDAEHDKLFPAPVIPGDRAKVRAFARAIEAAHGITGEKK